MNDCTRRRPVREPLAVRISDLVERLGRRLHDAGDEAARVEGLEVRVLHGGLTRRYRDPRFGSRAAYGAGRGAGATGDRP